jgi:predicted nucleic acid-binding protein
MAVEPGIVDTNVLVYALDADATQHLAARALLEAERDASTTLYVTSQILCEFYSIVTNPRRVPNPRRSGDALSAVSGLLAFLHVLPVPARTVDGWLNLLRRRPVTGGDVFDLQIIATMQANDVHRIYTFNTGDFEIFPELTVVTPAPGVQR